MAQIWHVGKEFNPHKVEQMCSKPFLGTGRDTRITLEWVEVAWWVPTDTIHVAGGGSRDRIGPGKAPLEVYRDPPNLPKLWEMGSYNPGEYHEHCQTRPVGIRLLQAAGVV
jgi:hypothetical protein